MSINITSLFTGLSENDGIWSAKVSEDISFPKEGHAQLYNFEDNSYWFQHRNHCLLALAKIHLKEKGFLDIGGGNGYVSSGFQAAGYTPIMMEPSMEGCLNSRKRGVKINICATLESAKPINNTVENAGAFDVIEHIANHDDFVKGIFKLLKPGAFFFITVPAYKFLWSGDDVKAGHYTRYTTKRMGTVLKDSGFEVVHSTYLFSFLVIPILIFRSIPFWLRLSRNGTTNEGYVSNHSKPKGLSGKILNSFLNWELKKIKSGHKLWFGSSILIIARKPAE